MRILVIEADAEISELISLAFSVGRPDAEILAMSSAEHGVDLVCNTDVDLIVVDLGLKNGEALGAIKDIRLGSAVPIIAVADSRTRNQLSDAAKLGANDCLIRPFELMEVLGKVCGLVEKRGIKHHKSALPPENKAKKNTPKYFGFVPNGPDSKNGPKIFAS